MKSRREFRLRLILASLGFIASLLQAPSVFGQAANAAAQPHGAAGLVALQRGALEVWVPKSPVMGMTDDPTARVSQDYPWSTLLNEFKSDFPDFDLRFKMLDRDEYLQAFHSSQQTPPYPDVAFVDNGRELNPLMKDSLARMMVQSRFPYRGWWLIFRSAKNSEAGKAFMLWLSRSPQWKPWQVSTASIGPADIAAVEAVSKNAVQDFEHADTQSLSLSMDREASHFDLRSTPTTTVESIDPLLTFGNSRLAFVLLSAVGQGEKMFGMNHFSMVLRKVDDHWKVLLFVSRPLPQLEDLLKSFDRLKLADGQPEALPKVKLIGPADHAWITRFPKCDLEWEAVDQLAVAYVVESQYGQPMRESWSTSWIRVVSPTHSASERSVELPFTVGMQPHRWRIWAISRNGVVSTSDWRTVDFTY